jgi:hypothetical protein
LIAVIVCTTPRMRVRRLELGRAESYQQQMIGRTGEET